MSTDKLNINQWAEEDRPREKMMTHGAAVLTDAELLAILIGSGSTKETAVELMRRVLAACGNNLNELGKLSLEQLCQFNGIGPAKAVTVMAACELGRRRKLAEVEERLVVRSSRDIYNCFHPKMADLPIEEFWVMLLLKPTTFFLRSGLPMPLPLSSMLVPTAHNFLGMCHL